MNNGKFTLSGSALKLIAVVCMVIDHTAAFLLNGHEDVFFCVGGVDVTLVSLMRVVGRLAFPIFAFLLVEGFCHTRNKLRYILQLFAFALISELPFDLAATGQLEYTWQNVFFSLALGTAGMWAVEYFGPGVFNRILAVTMIGCCAFCLRCDYSIGGFSCIMLIYILRQWGWVRLAAGCCAIPNTIISSLACIPVYLYNGQRGFVNNRFFKYFFYSFYPLHLLLIWLVREFL